MQSAKLAQQEKEIEMISHTIPVRRKKHWPVLPDILGSLPAAITLAAGLKSAEAF